MLSEKVINNKVYNTGTDDVKLFVYMHLTEIKFDFVHQMYVCLCVRVYVCTTVEPSMCLQDLGSHSGHWSFNWRVPGLVLMETVCYLKTTIKKCCQIQLHHATWPWSKVKVNESGMQW